MDIRMLYNVCQAMQPDMSEYADNTLMVRWCDYAVYLDEFIYTAENDGVEAFVTYVNSILRDKLSTSVEHEAATDVASTLQNLYPEFRNQFKF